MEYRHCLIWGAEPCPKAPRAVDSMGVGWEVEKGNHSSRTLLYLPAFQSVPLGPGHCLAGSVLVYQAQGFLLDIQHGINQHDGEGSTL